MSDVRDDPPDATAGLRQFLTRSAAIRRQTSSGPTGLQRFFDRAGPLLQAPLTVVAEAPLQPERSPLDLVHFRYVISVLAEPLRRAPLITPPLNVWATAGLKRDELRNAAVLAWFLDPRASHGLGPAFLAAFLDEVARSTQDWPRLVGDLSRATVATEEWPLSSTSNRVDIALDGPDFVFFVEVKIDAPEGPNQLVRYAEQAKRKAVLMDRAHGRVIYLTPRRPRQLPPDVAAITWRDVASALSALARENAGGSLAAQFAQHIRKF